MTIQSGGSVQTSESQADLSLQGFPRYLITAVLALAILLVAAAALFPSQQLEHRRVIDLDSRRDELIQQASGLQPSDDTYVKVPNTPYPVNTIKLFPALLSLDAAMLVIFAGILSKLSWSAGQVTRVGHWSIARTDWLLITILTVTGGALRSVGSDRSLWIDEISTLAWYVQAPAIDTF